MSRENTALKARRLLAEGRVRLLHIEEENGIVTAEVRGDSGRMYVVSHQPGYDWACDCQTRGRCSHITSLMLVCVLAPRQARR